MSKNDSLGAVFTVAALLFGVLLLAVMFWFVGDSTETVAAQKVVEPQPETAQAQPQINKPALPPGQAIVGGVQRPVSDVLLSKDATNRIPTSAPPKPEGGVPDVAGNANPEVKLVYDALKEKRNPELLSSSVVSHDFNKQEFDADPVVYAQKYASRPEPGRVFAPAQPGEGVAALKSVGARLHRVQQGESVRLSVQAVPNAPVTFTSFSTGQFANLLSSQTVVANADGLAEATYTATSGTKKQVRILAASPLTADQVAFTVSVKLPTDSSTAQK